MHWRNIGPFRGGRVLAVAGIPGDPKTYYFGAVAGGVWKSSDAGVNWKPLFDHETTSSIGAIAIADSDHNVIYAGTGEACIRGNMSYGDGVFKSMDDGKTWKNVGLRDTQHIGALIIDPKDSNVVFVAALGHAYGPNSERGIFRTRDGGKTWERVLYKDDHTGAIDVVFDPSNSNILYASLWQVMRTPYSLDSGGPGSGLYKSSDGGTTWKRLESNGLPEGIMGRIGVSVSGGDSNRIYA
ncbi:MAG: glycosyl hydrolase, partial [Acidobacteria bacterium]